MREFVLGTAGHIDHGKSALVRALTGIDTDRLAEEKSRGISIELGFAHLELGDVRLGIVDVPGHERFVRTMLAGASGLDFAMLVVAADDSVMPQTREHLAILELLRVPRGLVAITKCDLAEPAWLDLVEEDVRELTAGTFLAGAPVVRTSAPRGEGLDELRAVFGRLAGEAGDRRTGGTFRMPIDRSFVLQGLGTVVTGTVWSGAVTAGETLELQPAGRDVRVRAIQAYGSERERVGAGQRAAFNLTGIGHREIERGGELVAPGTLRASRWLSARVRVLAESPWPLRHRARVRLHLGTQEVMASVRLLDGLAAEPGSSALAQLVTAEPVVARAGQPIVLRSESPLRTIGGGTVLEPCARPLRRRDRVRIERLPDLESADPAVRAGAAIALAGLEAWNDLDLARAAGLELHAVAALVAALVERGDVIAGPLRTGRTLRVHRDVVRDAEARVERTLERMHRAAPLAPAIPRGQIVSALPALEEALVHWLLDRMGERGTVHLTGDAVALPAFAPRLTADQERVRAAIVEALRAAAFSPPDPDALAARAGVPPAALRPILELCAAEGEIVRLRGDLFLHATWEAELRARVARHLGDADDGLTMSSIKDVLETSRKYAVPLCEHLDRVGVTKRQGDRRVLASG